MTIGSILTIAASGMRARETALSALAANVANGSSEDWKPLETCFDALEGGGVEATVTQAPDAVPDLASDMVGLVEQRLAWSANAAVFETGASLWDLLAMTWHD